MRMLLKLSSTLKPSSGRLVGVQAEWVNDSDYADTLGFIDWSKVRSGARGPTTPLQS